MPQTLRFTFTMCPCRLWSIGRWAGWCCGRAGRSRSASRAGPGTFSSPSSSFRSEMTFLLDQFFAYHSQLGSYVRKMVPLFLAEHRPRHAHRTGCPREPDQSGFLCHQLRRLQRHDAALPAGQRHPAQHGLLLLLSHQRPHQCTQRMYDTNFWHSIAQLFLTLKHHFLVRPDWGRGDVEDFGLPRPAGHVREGVRQREVVGQGKTEHALSGDPCQAQATQERILNDNTKLVLVLKARFWFLKFLKFLKCNHFGSA